MIIFNKIFNNQKFIWIKLNWIPSSFDASSFAPFKLNVFLAEVMLANFLMGSGLSELNKVIIPKKHAQNMFFTWPQIST